jgi:hypothetical protein
LSWRPTKKERKERKKERKKERAEGESDKVAIRGRNGHFLPFK